MRSRAWIKKLMAALTAQYGQAKTELIHTSPFELLVATILSAQCTDKRVNMVTPELFARYPTPEALAQAEQGEVEAIIHSTGFFRNKAKNLIAMAKRLEEDFAGEVPPRMEALTSLPGVARKTANVVLGSAFGITSGVVVDTHVRRVANRLGLTSESDPSKVEHDLMRQLPQEMWIGSSHAIIQHGRRICVARRPRCNRCILTSLCPSATL